MTLTHFSKTTALQQVIFTGMLSTIIIFKLCKFNVNLLTLCYVLQKVLKSSKSTQILKRCNLHVYGQFSP